MKERETFRQYRLNTFYLLVLMKRKSTYINTRTYLSYSITFQLKWNYTFFRFSVSLISVHFINLLIYIFMFFYFMYLFFDIFIIFPLHVHKLVSTSCNSFVCVCLCGGGSGVSGVLNWVWTVCSKISFISKLFVAIKVKLLTLIWF